MTQGANTVPEIQTWITTHVLTQGILFYTVAVVESESARRASVTTAIRLTTEEA